MLVTPAFAQAAGAAPGGAASGLISFVPIILIFAIMYFLMIRPQQKKVKEHRAMVEAVRRGDQVITAGGLIGKVTKVDDQPRSRSSWRRTSRSGWCARPSARWSARPSPSRPEATGPRGPPGGDRRTMQNFPRWKQILILGTCLVGLVIALPNAFYGRVERANDARTAMAIGQPATPGLLADAAGWPSWLPSQLVNLGLDLRGGAHVLVQVETADVYGERMEGLWPVLRDALREQRDQIGTIRRLGGPADELRIRIGNRTASRRRLRWCRRRRSRSSRSPAAQAASSKPAPKATRSSSR